MLPIPLFLVKALLGSSLVSLASAPLGAFMIWKKMAYFGDALSHAGLLGIAIAIAFNINHFVGVLLVSFVFGWIMLLIKKSRYLSTDTILGILSHSSLALGLLAISLQDGFNNNLLSFLYGDILTITTFELLVIFCCTIFVLVAIYLIWEKLLLITINEDIAEVEGVDSSKILFVYVLLLSSLIAIAIKIVGVLLITSLLIIPNAIARKFSNSPEKLIAYAMVFGVLASVCGLFFSFHFDLPAGPCIVGVLFLTFILSLFTIK